MVPLLACVAVVVGLAVPAGAQEAEPPPVTTHIVGGSIAPEGAYGWTAAMIRRGASRTSGFRCGVVVLSRSWVLTAGHCVIDYDDQYPDSVYGNYVAPSFLDVLAGTQSLTSGGQLVHVAAIYPHPSYDYFTSDYDVALLRLARPISAQEIAVIGTSASELPLDDAGTEAIVSGWGTTSSGGSISTRLRYVGVPIQSNTTCGNAYYPGFRDSSGEPLEYHSSNMICAGPLGGGKDSCQGDSGGPLAVQAPDSSWRLVGTVSFGLGCARPGYPGVYQRLTATSSWIGNTRRFGPFNADGSAYVVQQYKDFVGRSPNSTELKNWTTKLRSTPAATLITELQASSAWDGNAGMNTRLYRATFLRNPDTNGLAYWVGKRWSGKSPVWIANFFTTSSEFKTRYGSLSNAQFVDQIYANVFGRAPDPSGRTYWVNKLNKGIGRGQALYEWSNSSEYRRKTDTLVRIITTRFGLLRAVPSAGEIADSQALSQRTLVDTLRTSYRYAARFNG
jgi:secreted trypsin-like serine protease